MLRFFILTVAFFGPALGRPELLIPSDRKLGGDRIAGGAVGEIEDFPYQVALLYYGQITCGASILNPTIVLTGAHCTYEIPDMTEVSIRAGSKYFYKDGQVVQVLEKHEHPMYDNSQTNFDVCILKLESKITIAVARAVPLAAAGSTVQAGSMAVVSGWGHNETAAGNVSPLLQFVDLPIIARDVCYNIYHPYGEIVNENHICTGYLDVGGKDACQGDSGGPLVQNGVQIGIISWGYGCGLPGYPNVYSNIANFRSFIDQFL